MPSTIEFSYVGYTTVTRKITEATTNMTILLDEAVNMLDETVIVDFSAKKRDVTAAVQVVESEDLVQTPVANMELPRTFPG